MTTAPIQPGSSRGAIPLIHPNNYRWEAGQGALVPIPHRERETMTLVPEAVSILKGIREPIAVVAITGPARSGKSYMLSELQDGVEFELGHTMTSQTTGIWMAREPKLFTNAKGQTVRLILLDTEGIGAAAARDGQANDKFDNQIFTLTTLISSLLIYNSSSVPDANDLEKLNFIAKLSESIHAQLHSGAADLEAIAAFRQYSPDFFWLLRDVLLVPTNQRGEVCDIKTYLDQNVLKLDDEDTSSGVVAKKNAIRKNIREIFPTFDAYGLPPPSVDPRVVQNLSSPEYRGQVSPFFLSEIEKVKHTLLGKVKPKKVSGMAFMTGEQFTRILTMYNDALNTKGGVPEWRSSWETAIKITNENSVALAIETYKKSLVEVERELPCPVERLLEFHANSLQKAKDVFQEETKMNTDAKLLQEYSTQFMNACAQFDERTMLCNGGFLFEMWSKNERLSESFCKTLMTKLQEDIVDPLLSNISSDTSFEILISCIESVKSEYQEKARGPCAKRVQEEYTIQFQKRLKQAASEIEKMKDYDAKIADELNQRMAAEANMEKMAEEQKNLEQSMQMQEAQFKQQTAMFEEQQKNAAAEAERLREALEKNKEHMNTVVQDMTKKQKEEIGRLLSIQKDQQDRMERDREADRELAERHQQALKQQMEAQAANLKEAMESMQRRHREEMERAKSAKSEGFNINLTLPLPLPNKCAQQ